MKRVRVALSVGLLVSAVYSVTVSCADRRDPEPAEAHAAEAHAVEALPQDRANQRAARANQTVDLALQNVEIFDSRTKTVQEEKTILIAGDRILAIVDADTAVTAEQVLDGRGRLAVPGFVDTHAHLGQIVGSDRDPEDASRPLSANDRRQLSRQYLAHGTTTLVDMGQAESWLETSVGWQNDPSPEFPNLYVTGGSLVSTGDEAPPHFVQVTSQTVKAKLTEYKALGIDRIKLYRKLELDDMKAAVTAANELGIRYFAHTDNNVVTIQEALALGVTDFEHFFTVVPSTLPFREEIGPLLASQGLEGIRSDDEYAATMVFFFDAIAKRPDAKERLLALFQEMAAHGASLSTTINVLASAAGRTDFYCSFTPVPDATEATLSYDGAQRERLRESFDDLLRFVRVAHETGVSLRIGTDCWYGGRALLSELLILQEAGISAEDVLQIATWNGAVALGLEEELGHLAPGKRADMILFASHPLEDPQNLLGPKTIIKSGQVYTP